MSASVNPDIVTDGLVLCLDAANPDSYPGSGSTWYDLSGNNNHSTLSGPSFGSDQYAKYMHFAGADYADCGMNNFQPTEFTISTWVNSLFTNSTIILGKGNINSVEEWGLGFGYTSRLVSRMRYYADQILYEYSSLTSQPHMLTVTAKNTLFHRLYIDSVLVDQDVNVGSIGYDESKPIYLGRWNNYNPAGKSFYLYNAGLYNRALEVDEIENNYNALKGRYGL